jgi:hypothetical protein
LCHIFLVSKILKGPTNLVCKDLVSLLIDPTLPPPPRSAGLLVHSPMRRNRFNVGGAGALSEHIPSQITHAPHSNAESVSCIPE